VLRRAVRKMNKESGPVIIAGGISIDILQQL